MLVPQILVKHTMCKLMATNNMVEVNVIVGLTIRIETSYSLIAKRTLSSFIFIEKVILRNIAAYGKESKHKKRN